MKISCGVAGDLLPLYVDGCCSEESEHSPEHLMSVRSAKMGTYEKK